MCFVHCTIVQFSLLLLMLDSEDFVYDNSIVPLFVVFFSMYTLYNLRTIMLPMLFGALVEPIQCH
jgi:hypothetical protein